MHFYYTVYITHLGIQIVKQDYKIYILHFKGDFRFSRVILAVNDFCSM